MRTTRACLPLMLGVGAALSCGGVSSLDSGTVDASPAPVDAGVEADVANLHPDVADSEATACDDAVWSPEIIVTGQNTPHSLVATAGSLLWIDNVPNIEKGFAGGDLWQASTDGAAATRLWTLPWNSDWYLVGLGVDAAYAYTAAWCAVPCAGYHGVVRVRRDGGGGGVWIPPGSIGVPGGPYEVVGENSASVVWREGGWLMREGKQDGMPGQLVDDAGVRSVVVDDDFLWISRCKYGCAIERLSLETLQSEVIAEVDDVATMVADSVALYWTDATTQRIRALPKAGGAIVDVAVISPQSRLLAINASHVFWADEQAHRIRAVAKTGGGVFTLACMQRYVRTLAADDSFAYWGQESNDDSPTGWIERAPAQSKP